MSEISKSFYYPDLREGQKVTPSNRMCSAGQKLAVSLAYDLLVPGAPLGVAQTFDRAAKAGRRMKLGANVNKHAVISWVVVDLFDRGELDQYANDRGDYLLETYTGEHFERNIFDDIEAGKIIF